MEDALILTSLGCEGGRVCGPAADLDISMFLATTLGLMVACSTSLTLSSLSSSSFSSLATQPSLALLFLAPLLCSSSSAYRGGTVVKSIPRKNHLTVGKGAVLSSWAGAVGGQVSTQGRLVSEGEEF